MSEQLAGKKILLGVTGGIAAYKTAELCRNLVKLGGEVRVIMTQGAEEFVRPLTFQALTGNPVHTSLLDPDAEAGMGHIELAKWPDLIVVAPATAHFIAQYSQGLAGDLLLTCLLASTAPVAIAPAMNQAMWLHPLTQRNLKSLKVSMADHLHIWGPQAGEQACGDVGPGRLEEPADLAQHIVNTLSDPRLPVATGWSVVITAGPTREAIDPVRYISNHSSGKMGFALAECFAAAGAKVTLLAGPVNLNTPEGVQRIDVNSAEDMHKAAMQACEKGCRVFIAAAAVADYRIASPAEQKIKKSQDRMQLELVRNPDIVADVAALPHKPFTVGFAAETQDVLTYAKGKLERKGLDMIIANDVSRQDIGFNADHNEVHVLTARHHNHLARQEKGKLAACLVAEIVEACSEESSLS